MDGKIKLARLYSEGVEWFLFLSLAKTNHQMIPFFSCIDEYGWFASLCVCAVAVNAVYVCLKIHK